MNVSGPTPNLKVFLLLWKAARRRSRARKQRQSQLMSHKSGSTSDSFSGLMSFISFLVAISIHAILAWMLIDSIELTGEIEAEKNEKIVIEHDTFTALHTAEHLQVSADERSIDFGFEPWHRARESGESQEYHRKLLEKHYAAHGIDGFVDRNEVSKLNFSNIQGIPDAVWILGSIFVLWWFTMIVCQGEGLELDIQRRRHPMWEWIQSHPVRPVAAFAADMLSPMVANPVYLCAPVFWGIIFGSVFNPGVGMLLSIPVGLSFALAASTLNKSLEILVMLRMAPRNRGAVLGLISWFGYAGMMLPFFMLQSQPLRLFLARKADAVSAILPAFPIRWILVGWGSEASVWKAGVVGILAAFGVLLFAVSLAWWGARQGLQASESQAHPNSMKRDRPPEGKWLAKNPLYRKEMLWFLRDKGAVIQALLIPLTVASFQIINLQNLIDDMVLSWNGMSGAAVICGTYFLLVLGPRSLASEGTSLWIATTWPHGLEDLLKAKARLWWFFSSAIVLPILAVIIWISPADWWKVLLVAVGWLGFGKSLAEKTVTLATVTSSSGEAEPAPKGRNWAALLGTFIFSAGVFTANWSLAVIGVIFSNLTASAMWQNFRARLPYFFDPWSEKLPPAPSLMHSMIVIAVMVEMLGVFTVVIHVFSVDSGVLFARTLAYGLIGLTAWSIMSAFLKKRGVTGKMIWEWERPGAAPSSAAAYAIAVIIGAVLAGFAMLYLMGLRVFPPTAEFMAGIHQMGSAKSEAWLIFIMAVGMAPIAEEYLFRGLLFRSLDREKKGIAALIWSSAYFAIYHPPVSWVPVFFLGLGCGWLYKKSGRLGPSVLLHMTYNALVILLQS